MSTLKAGYRPSAGSEIDLQDHEHLLGTEPSSSSRPGLEPYRDLEPDDNPPAYSDIEDPTPTTLHTREATGTAVWEVGSYHATGGKVICSSNGSYTITQEPIYSTGPNELFFLIATQARLPPNVSVAVTGTHTVATSRDGKKSHDTVTDFDFHIDGTNSILPPLTREEIRGDYFDQFFRELSVIDDEDDMKAYRGSCIKRKKAARGKFPTLDLEEQPSTLGTQYFPPKKYYKDLYMWCHRFCEDKALLKSFTLRRELHNWGFPLIKQEVISVIRSTNYRGSIDVKLYMGHSSITVRSPSRINTLRANNFVWWACVILQLWIITWPIIFLMEQRYEIIRAKYYVFRDGSRANSLSSELRWVERFSPAIRAAALGRRTNQELVTLSDVDRLQAARPEERSRAGRGDGSLSESVVGVVRGVAEVGRQWNLSLGWGGNE